MKLTKKRDYTGAIRKVWNDAKSKCYGVIGTVDELLETGILDFCDAPAGTWCFIPVDAEKAYFADTRDGVLFEPKERFPT